MPCGNEQASPKKVQGELRVINLHLDKIASELAKPNPNLMDIVKWEQDIVRHQRISSKLMSMLPGRRGE